ncbi:MAG: CDP-glucose 4,6-dehydratase, partial [Verrucomicrobiota bacterium]
MFANFYSGKRVFVTGHTGFKGSWLSLWLKNLGATVFGFSLAPTTDPNLYQVIRPFAVAKEVIEDIRDLTRLKSSIEQFEPEIIFHLAAQPLVRQSYREPLATFQTNALGTANLLEAIRQLELPCPVVVVTTDKCYENHAWSFAYRECDALGGHDIYSISKASAELVVQGWRRSFFSVNSQLGNLASARAGNVIGGG